MLMHDAKRCDIIHGMAEQERPTRTNRRENIVLLIKACHRRFDVTRGGQTYLSNASHTSNTYISAVVHNERGCGDDVAEKIERAFRLPPGWLDHAHHDADLDELATRHVPFSPGARIGRKSSPPKKRESDTEVAQLRRLVESQRLDIEQLAAEVAEIKNTPK